MESINEYRALAAKLKREGMASLLPNVRELKLNAARRWEELADETELVIRPSCRRSEMWIY